MNLDGFLGEPCLLALLPGPRLMCVHRLMTCTVVPNKLWVVLIDDAVVLGVLRGVWFLVTNI
jgi:hypothetical protein